MIEHLDGFQIRLFILLYDVLLSAGNVLKINFHGLLELLIYNETPSKENLGIIGLLLQILHQVALYLLFDWRVPQAHVDKSFEYLIILLLSVAAPFFVFLQPPLYLP